MTAHLLVLGANEDDALHYVLHSRTLARRRAEGAHIVLIWPGVFHRVIHSDPFDDLHVSEAVICDPNTHRRDTWIAACRSRVKGPDGRTPAERIAR